MDPEKISSFAKVGDAEVIQSYVSVCNYKPGAFFYETYRGVRSFCYLRIAGFHVEC